MLIIDNKAITTPILTLVNMLKQDLVLNHINKLKYIEQKGDNIRITCPIHNLGNENKPSCDILVDDKNYKNRVIPAGTVTCFACGYKANFIKFVSDCLNISYKQAIEWILDHSDYDYIENVRDIDMLDDLDSENDPYAGFNVTLDELKQYDYVHDYMFERKLTYPIIKKFDVGYDPKLDAITFPVWVNGKCLFVCKRRIKYKRFDMPSISPKPIYGLDYITDNEVIVCESVINALYSWTLGHQAIALFGTGSDYQIELLQNSGIRSFVLAFDGDEAGHKAARKFKKSLSSFAIVTQMILPDGKDLNDLSEEEFKNLYESREWF